MCRSIDKKEDDCSCDMIVSGLITIVIVICMLAPAAAWAAITTHPSDLTVREGESAEFFVTATGTNLSYQWQKDEVDIPDATDSTCTISETTLSDNGSMFRCVVSSSDGSEVSFAATLRVLMRGDLDGDGDIDRYDVNVINTYRNQPASVCPECDIDGDGTITVLDARKLMLMCTCPRCICTTSLPEITSHPSNVTVTAGQPAAFSITAAGSGLSCQWQRGTSDISGATNLSYTISETALSDNWATYRCVVSNAAGNVVSNAATLFVNEVVSEGPEITSHPSDVTVTEGQSATFSVTATGPNLSYQWQKDEAAIPNATDSTCTISETTLSDNGTTYRCVVSNASGSVTSNSATLSVSMAAPEISVHPSALTVAEGEPAEFSVTATGSNLSYQWQKDEAAIPAATDSTYTISETTLSDNGTTYRCVVSNAGGSVTSNSATLSVSMAAPEITAHPSDVAVAEGEPAEFSVTATGSNLSYQWQKDETDIPDATDSTYSISEATLSDNGSTFCCVVSNAGGSVTSNSATLTVTSVIEPPVIQTQPSDLMVFVGEAAEFSIVAVGSNLTYQWQRHSSDIEGANQATYAIPGVAFSDNGAAFRCIVSNSQGSVTSTVVTLTVIDNQPPELTVDGPEERTTSDDFAQITGVAIDTGAGLGAVEVTSTQYPGQVFGAIVNTVGAFSAEVPLHVGENQLTVTARDNAGNQAQKSVKVTLEIAALPTITIDTPANGTTVTEDRITVAGVVRSTLSPEEIRVVLGGNVKFPTGTGGEYTFSFENIQLAEGANTLTVTAETVYGNVSAQTTVSYVVETPEEEVEPPVIEIHSSSQPEVFLTEDSIVVSGTASSAQGISSVTVNGQEATIVGSGTQVSFQYEVLFSGLGEDEIEIVVEATDGEGNTSSVSYVVRYDATAPVIQVTSSGLQMAPEVNSVTETPYAITGTVIEKNLAGVSMNGQSVGVLPTGNDDEWSFDVGVVLVRGEERTIAIEAWDMAGNRTSQELILLLEASLDIEIISPAADAQFIATGETLDVEVIVRVPGMAADDQVNARVDEGSATTLDRTGDTARGTLSVDAATDGTHKLVVEVTDAGGAVIAGTTTSFSIVNTANIPLSLERQEPENGETGVEPNEFIAFYFNKPIDPALLQVEVVETAHGKIYATPEKGADITQMSDIQLVDVHRDRETVPGGMSHFPENTMAAFYAEQDFAYDGTVYVTVLYDGEDLSRSSFKIRPLPTFIQGFVADQFMVPVAGIEVEISELGRRSVSDKNGAYGFGFGEPAEMTIPGGRYRAVVNPGMKNREFGSVEVFMSVEGGRLNSVGLTKIPIINPEEPFRRIQSGQEQALLAAGGLTLDLSSTALNFPDGRDEGDVHVQFMQLQEISYGFLPSTVPHWVYAVQPMGIEVGGHVGITFDMPKLYESHEYVAEIGDWVVLVGLDPESLKVVPVGVGSVDKESKKVTSVGDVVMERLDILGYAMVPEEAQEVLERYAGGEIGLTQMIGELEAAR